MVERWTSVSAAMGWVGWIGVGGVDRGGWGG